MDCFTYQKPPAPQLSKFSFVPLLLKHYIIYKKAIEDYNKGFKIPTLGSRYAPTSIQLFVYT